MGISHYIKEIGRGKRRRAGRSTREQAADLFGQVLDGTRHRPGDRRASAWRCASRAKRRKRWPASSTRRTRACDRFPAGRAAAGRAAQLQRRAQAAGADAAAGAAAGARGPAGAGARQRPPNRAASWRRTCSQRSASPPLTAIESHRDRRGRLRADRTAEPRPEAPARRAPRGRPAQPGAQRGQADEADCAGPCVRGRQLHASRIRRFDGRDLRAASARPRCCCAAPKAKWWPTRAARADGRLRRAASASRCRTQQPGTLAECRTCRRRSTSTARPPTSRARAGRRAAGAGADRAAGANTSCNWQRRHEHIELTFPPRHLHPGRRRPGRPGTADAQGRQGDPGRHRAAGRRPGQRRDRWPARGPARASCTSASAAAARARRRPSSRS